MEIREATTGDERAIKALIALFPDELVQDHLPNTDSFFVAEENGKVIGCCALEVYSPKIAEVRSLAIAKEWQGKGIAKRLVEKCVERAKEMGVYQVLAITGNPTFFDKFGFHTFNQEKYAVFTYLR